MADSLSMALTELLRKAEAEPDLDTLREGVRVLTQALMKLEVAQHLGAERCQRTRSGRASATVIGSAPGTRAWARSSCACRASGPRRRTTELGSTGRTPSARAITRRHLQITVRLR